MLLSPSTMLFQGGNYNSEWLWDDLNLIVRQHEATADDDKDSCSFIQRLSSFGSSSSSTTSQSQSQPFFPHSFLSPLGALQPQLSDPVITNITPLLLSSSSPPQTLCGTTTTTTTVIKKLNHNASERDRRKKLNGLYSSLRSLLPPTAHQMKKQSIPTTVSRVLKYVPELKQQLERLLQEKEHLLSRISRESVVSVDYYRQPKSQDEYKRSTATGAAVSVTVSRLNEKELALQISQQKQLPENLPFSEVIGVLEKDGFSLMNASSLGGSRVFYNLHVQAAAGRNMKVECEPLREKILSVCDKNWRDL